ncbi:GTP-binding protein TypA, partial [Trifolium pratense]
CDFQVTSTEYEGHKGCIGIGRLEAGVLERDGGQGGVPADRVEAGDICAVCGISDIQIGETIADKVTGKALPSIKVEEPTVKMAFSINTSPFVGREVCI